MREHRANRFPQALDAYRRTLKLDPQNVDAHMNLGAVLTTLGQQAEARKHFTRALGIQPDNASMRRDFARALIEFGSWDDALVQLDRAIVAEPGDPRAHVNAGFVHLENGRKKEAVAALERAIAIDPMFAPTYFTKHVALYDDSDVTAAADALTHAVAYDPENVSYRFHLAVLLDQLGQAAAARQQFASLGPEKSIRGAVDSWDYIKTKRTAATRIFATAREVLLFGLDQAKLGGSVMQVGVRYGTAIRWIAGHVRGTVYGFDGEAPDVPANAEIVAGPFERTLPAFARSHAEPLRYASLICDRFGCAKTALDAIGDRIVPGTVIVLDGYVVADNWRDGAFKAFQEAVAARGWRYEYVAFGMLTQQAVVRIL